SLQCFLALSLRYDPFGNGNLLSVCSSSWISSCGEPLSKRYANLLSTDSTVPHRDVVVDDRDEDDRRGRHNSPRDAAPIRTPSRSPVIEFVPLCLLRDHRFACAWNARAPGRDQYQSTIDSLAHTRHPPARSGRGPLEPARRVLMNKEVESEFHR